METEVDYCDTCHKRRPVTRTYYEYDIPCECYGGQYHFQVVRTCQNCKPQPPEWVQAQIRPIGQR